MMGFIKTNFYCWEMLILLQQFGAAGDSAAWRVTPAARGTGRVASPWGGGSRQPHRQQHERLLLERSLLLLLLPFLSSSFPAG